MWQEKLYHFIVERKGWIPLLILFLIFISFEYMTNITTIVIFSLFFAYLVHPFVVLLEKVKISRYFGAFLTIFFFFSFISMVFLIIFPIFYAEVRSIVIHFPDLINKLIETIVDLGKELDVNLDDVKTLKQMLTGATFFIKPLSSFLKGIFVSSWTLFGFIVNVVIFFVISFFTIAKWNVVAESIYSLIPLYMRTDAMVWLKRIDRILAGFVRGQFLVAITLGTLYSIGFWIIGLKHPFSFGVMVGISCLVPYVGLFTSISLISLLTLLNSSPYMLLKILLVLLIIQALDTTLITPNIMGKKVGMSPVFVVIALFGGGEFGGFLGVLIAVPTFAILKIFFEELIKRYKESDFYKMNSS